MSVDIACVFYYYNAEKILIFSYDVTEYVHLRGDRI